MIAAACAAMLAGPMVAAVAGVFIARLDPRGAWKRAGNRSIIQSATVSARRTEAPALRGDK